MGLRPGTEPIELIVGLDRALRLWQRDATTRMARMAALRDHLEERLRHAGLGPVVHGAGSSRLPHTTNIAFPRLNCQAIHMALDLAGVICSVGSACAGAGDAPSPVLRAMQLPSEVVDSTVRFSLGSFTTRQDIDTAAHRIIEVARRLYQNRGEQHFQPLRPA